MGECGSEPSGQSSPIDPTPPPTHTHRDASSAGGLGGDGSGNRNYFLPHLRKSTMPVDDATQRKVRFGGIPLACCVPCEAKGGMGGSMVGWWGPHTGPGPTHAQVCFYFNVMREGCRKPAEQCEFAHVYVEGALEARQEAEAQDLLPRSASGGSEAGEGGGVGRAASLTSSGEGNEQHQQHQHQQHQHQQPNPPPPPSTTGGGYHGNDGEARAPAGHPSSARSSSSHRTGPGRGGWRRQRAMAPPPPSLDRGSAFGMPGPPPFYGGDSASHYHPAALAPMASAHHYDAYAGPTLPMPPPPPPPPSYAAAGGYEDGAGPGGVYYPPTKTYVNMPRTATGQRVCYYHNVGKCTNVVCPFVHVLVRAGEHFRAVVRVWW
jgi:hypothetical protein